MKEKKTLNLGKRLKQLFDEDRQRVAARLIEQASVEQFGELHFVYTKEAAVLASVDIDKLKAFISRVEEIRFEVDEEYKATLKKLGGATNEAA